jgi:hypothetical protein
METVYDEESELLSDTPVNDVSDYAHSQERVFAQPRGWRERHPDANNILPSNFGCTSYEDYASPYGASQDDIFETDIEAKYKQDYAFTVPEENADGVQQEGPHSDGTNDPSADMNFVNVHDSIPEANFVPVASNPPELNPLAPEGADNSLASTWFFRPQEIVYNPVFPHHTIMIPMLPSIEGAKSMPPPEIPYLNPRASKEELYELHIVHSKR